MRPRGRAARPPQRLAAARLRSKLLHPCSLAFLHFFGRQVFFVGGDRPRVPFRVDDSATPVTPELVLHLPHWPVRALGACRLGAIEERVEIFDVYPERRRWAA